MKTCVLALIISVSFFSFNALSCGQLSTVPYQSYSENPFGYVEYLPCNFDTTGETKYPILFWFSGLAYAGDGSDTSLTNQILDNNINEWLKTNDIPFIVLSPQSNNGYWEGSPLRTLTFYEWVMDTYSNYINPDQIHIAGWSAGGYGVSSMIPETPQVTTFTLMSTSTNSANAHYEDIINNDQYVWIHHGLLDESPNALSSVLFFYESLYDVDSSRVRLTVYSDLKHSAWNEVYDNSGRTTNKEMGSYLSNEKSYPYFNWTSENKTWYEWMLSKGASKVITSEKKNNTELDVSLSPNPINNHKKLLIKSTKLDLSTLQVTIFTALGKQIAPKNIKSTKSVLEINIEEFPNEIYYVNLQNDKTTQVLKFIVQ